MLISLLILVLVVGAIFYIATLIPIPQPFKNIMLVIIGVIALIYLIGLLTGHAAAPALWLR